MNTKTIAVVTTVYNDNKCLPFLLHSLLNQTDTFFTHYIYDDGSMNPPDGIVYNYIDEINRNNKKITVKYIKGTKNIKVNKAHEKVFQLLDEDYFTWIDSDDWVDKKFVQTLRKEIERNENIDVFHVNSKQYDEEKNVINKSTARFLSRRARKDIDQFPYYCLDGLYFYHNFLVKTKSFREVNPNSLIFEANTNKPFWYDAQIMFEMAVTHKLFKLIKKPLSNIVCRANSVSRSNDINVKEKYNTYDEIRDIFNIMNVSDDDKELFYTLLPFSKRRNLLYSNVVSGHIDGAKKQIKEDKAFIRKNGYPKSYLILDDEIRYQLFRRRFMFIIKPIKRIINMFR